MLFTEDRTVKDSQPQSVVFHVSPDGHDGWSGEIDSPNSENTDGPFNTLQRARRAVRDVVAGGMESDVIVEVRGGLYCLKEPLILDQNDAGRDGYEVVYRGRQGEDAVLAGGMEVVDWQQCDDGAYITRVPGGRSLRSIYENGQRGHPARFPDSGYLRAAGPVEDDPKRKFYFAESDVPRVEDTAHLEVCIWPGGESGEWNWFFNTIPVTRIDYQNRVIELAEEARYEIGPGSRYFLQGAGDFLTVPGEFHHDARRGTLRYRPRSLPIEDRNMVIPTADAVVKISGNSPENPVRHITMEGLTLGVTRSGSGVVHLDNAERVTVQKCRIRNAGGCGIRFDGHVRRCNFFNNLIHDVGYTGIYGTAPSQTRRYVSRENCIANNHIFECGRIVRHGAGLQLSNSGDTDILHNRIHDVPRYAISLKSPRPGVIIGETIDGVEVTRENAKEFAHARNNVITLNDLSRANMDSQDTGVIEAWGAGTGNIISQNRVHHSNIYMSFGFGIYLDDACDEFLVSHNIVDCIQQEGDGTLWAPLLIKGVKNHITNNLVVRNRAETAMQFIEMAHEPNRRISIYDNVFCNTGDNVYCFQNHDTEADWQEDRLAYSDRNLFHNASGRYGIEGVPEVETIEEWREIMGRVYDRYSRVADPQFVDAEAEDYRLRHDSPARDLGYQEIDPRPIGLTADFPFAEPDEPLAAIFPSVNDCYTGAFEMESGGEATLEVIARTQTGYVADLEEAQISFSSENEAVASVDDAGVVQAHREGTALIHIHLQRREEEMGTVQEIVVHSCSAPQR
jgi:hypothetical protein